MSAHSGADFEAGRTGRGEQLEGVDVVDGRDNSGSTANSGGRQSGIAGFLSGANLGAATSPGEGDKYVNGRRMRQKQVPEQRSITFTGPGSYKDKQITVLEGSHAAEDARWMLILEKKEG